MNGFQDIREAGLCANQALKLCLLSFDLFEVMPQDLALILQALRLACYVLLVNLTEGVKPDQPPFRILQGSDLSPQPLRLFVP